MQVCKSHNFNMFKLGFVITCSPWSMMNSYPTANYSPNTYQSPVPPQVKLRDGVNYAFQSAEAGVPASCISFARMLMTGIWDTEQMKIDCLCSRLLPPPQDSKLDPYLILARDPVRAIYYLRKVADLNDPDQTWSINQARNLIAFCQANGLAGFPPGPVSYPNAERLPKEDEEMLITNAKNADTGVNGMPFYGFVPLPNVRPEVPDPIGEIFQNVAISERDKCYWLMLAFTIASVVACVFRIELLIPGLILILVLIVLPFGIFYYLTDTYGVKQKIPICACQRIRLARELQLEEFPPEYSYNATDPFVDSMKNLNSAKQWLFWTYLFAPIVSFGLLVTFNGILDRFALSKPMKELYWWVPIFMFLIGSVTLAVEKRTPNWCRTSDGEDGGFIGMVVLAFCFFCLHDSSCHDQAFKIIERWHLNGAPKYAKISTISKMSE